MNFLAHKPEYWYSPNNKVANTVFNHIKSNHDNINRACYFSLGSETNVASQKEVKANRNIMVFIQLNKDKDMVDIEGNKEISKLTVKFTTL